MDTDKKHPTILVVEDSKLALEQLRRRITDDLSFTVFTASDFATASELITTRASEFFAAVLDLNLPDAKQGEVVDLAIEHGVPSIVFTSSVSPEVRERIIAKDIVDYVVKNRRAFDEVVYIISRLSKNREMKVLVVDDSRSARALIRHQLELNMFQVLEAESGEEALELVRSHGDVRMVISDFAMGGMDGVELTAKLRARYNREQMVIIGVSSHSDRGLSAQFIKQGADDYLNKPFEKEEFTCRVFHNAETIEHQRRLRELDELKNRFLGMVAHDLRNPIHAVRGFSELLLLEELSQDQKEMVAFVHSASGHMDDLVGDLLDISVIESGKLVLELADEDFIDLVRERIRGMRIPAERKSIDIVTEFTGRAPCSMDRARVAQVVDNLLSNAIKFSPNGTTVTVSLERPEGGLTLTVSDEGPGVPAKDRARLFEFFQRLTAKPTGGESSTGLGLAICRKIVEVHGGTISVAGAPGGGAAFSVTLPLVPPEG